MARGWHYAKFSLSSALRLSFSGMCILLFLFLYFCHLCFCLFVFFFCSRWSLVDVPLIFFCPADHVLDWQPRILLGMVEARSVNKCEENNNNQAPIPVCLDGTIIDSRTILVTMYLKKNQNTPRPSEHYCGYVGV